MLRGNGIGPRFGVYTLYDDTSCLGIEIFPEDLVGMSNGEDQMLYDRSRSTCQNDPPRGCICIAYQQAHQTGG